MGSFTSATARILMDAIFPATPTSLDTLSAAGTVASYRIYNNSDTANAVGIRMTGAGTKVIHSCHLVVGSVTVNGNAPGTGLTDTNFASGASNASARVGTISGTTTPTGQGANTVTYPTQAQYGGYTGKVMVAAAAGSHDWRGWTITENAGKGEAVSNGPIAFPQSSTGTCTVWGFVIAGQAADAQPASATTLIAAPTNTTAPLIIAYGDLSSSRSLSAQDTPVFASGAITITLD
jgi:hypothetical protein